MQHAFRSKWALFGLALCVALSTGALLAQDNAGGSGVSFTNNSKHDVAVFARFGGESCDHMPTQVELHVAAGSTSSVDSGSSKVCFCLDIPARDTCPQGWTTVKPGGKRILM
jgi:hypothetical protein